MGTLHTEQYNTENFKPAAGVPDWFTKDDLLAMRKRILFMWHNAKDHGLFIVRWNDNKNSRKFLKEYLAGLGIDAPKHYARQKDWEQFYLEQFPGEFNTETLELV